MNKKLLKIASLLMCFLYSLSVFQVSFAGAESQNRAAIAGYTGSISGKALNGWFVSNPFSGNDLSFASDEEYVNILDDNSSKYNSEAYLPMNDLTEGKVILNYSFQTDRVMQNTYFTLIEGTNAVLNLVTQNDGIYFPDFYGNKTLLCSYEANKVYGVRIFLDLSEKLVERIQINGVTCAINKPFLSNFQSIDGFSIKTGAEETGVLLIKEFYADTGYFVKETFRGTDGVVPDDWTSSGSVSLRSKNSSSDDSYDLLLNASSGNCSVSKSVEQLSGNLEFDISILQPEKGGSFSILLSGGENKAVEITSDGSSFYSNTSTGRSAFVSYTANVYNKLNIKLNTATKTADVYFNNRVMKEGIPFDGNAEFIDKITVSLNQGNKPVYIDDIALSYSLTYAADYPQITQRPQKKADSPLIAMQICPMWTQGQHNGWGYIQQASDNRKPVLGFYDDSNPEQLDWTIKYMVEHGVDFMNICMFPYLPSDSSQTPTASTATATRNTGFINAYFESKYCKDINFAIFLEANGLKNYGNSYYDDFFNVILPQYIEMYFKHPQYQKINGRPIFGIYSPTNFFDMLDTGNLWDGLTEKARIQKGIKKIRQMCKDAGVGDPYLVANSYNYISKCIDYGMDAVASYGYNGNNNFTAQKKSLENHKASAGNKIDFIATITPMRDDTAWRTSQGFMHSEAETLSQLNWINNTIFNGYNPPKGGEKIVNISTWDEYGEGHIVAPTEGNGFAYLDAIRAFVSNDSQHTDVVPTASQKARITRMYREDFEVPVVDYESEPADRRVFSKSIERDIDSDSYGNVVKTWDLSLDTDSEQITTENCTSSKTSAGLVLTPTLDSEGFSNPIIRIAGINNLDIGNISHIKIRMKKNSSSAGGNVFWKNNFFTEINEGRSMYFSTEAGDGSSVVDYYAPVYERASWAGKLTELEIRLGYVTNNSNLTVESISLVEFPDYQNKSKVVTDLQTQVVEDGFVVNNGTLMLPLKQVGNIIGAEEILYYGSENKYLIKYGGSVSEIWVGRSTAKTDGVTFTLSSNMYKAENNVMYAPIGFFEKAFYDVDFEYDTSTGTLNAVKNSAERKRVIYEVKGDSFASYGNISIESKYNGKVVGVSTSSDPKCTSDELNFAASKVKEIEVRIWVEKECSAELFYITDVSTGYNSTKRIPISLAKGYNELVFDTSTLSAWSGNITGIRLDPITKSDVRFSLDSVSFLKEEVVVVPPEDVVGPDAFKPIYALGKEKVVSVYGRADSEFIGKTVSVLLLKRDADINQISLSDIVYINETRVQNDGRYSISFKCKDSVIPSECKLYVRIGKRNITESVITAVASEYEILNCSVNVNLDNSTATATVTTEDLYGFDKTECEYKPLLAFYGNNGALMDIVIGESNVKEIKASIPQNTQNVEAFVFKNLLTLVPLCNSVDASISQ